MGNQPNRKNIRLREFDYNTPGAYFLTLCTQERKCILSRIVGTGVLDGPHRAPTGILCAEHYGQQIELLPRGKIADKYIHQLNAFYDNIHVESYVIMPNHIHLLLSVNENGPSGTPVPTMQNSTISRFISTFKRFCNREYGENFWQSRSYDHIIRDQADFDKHLKYICENPAKWEEDKLYIPE